MHNIIDIQNLGLAFNGKICFENFSTQIFPGSRIAVIGNNGSGKSTLLKIILGLIDSTEGSVSGNKNVSIGYVPQLIDSYENLSGGEKFNKALSDALADNPDILILDEPTNHLDRKNRKSLMRMLQYYYGTLIVVSHDRELLRNNVDTLWAIEPNGKITVFNGSYDDYRQTVQQKRNEIETELSSLQKEKRENHKALMQEQQRAKKSKAHGEKMVAQRKWLPVLGNENKSKSEKTSGKNKERISQKREDLNERLSELHIPQVIRPKFSLTAQEISNKAIVTISDGTVGYGTKPIIENINISLNGNDHLAIIGDNGSGKTTLFKAILSSSDVVRRGNWYVPSRENIGYLDQHYSTLDAKDSVLATIERVAPNKSPQEIRELLNSFLFKKNEDVNKKVAVLSGGEKARLCLAQISVKTPKLLLVDEITNNIDMETKEHVAMILKEYPGAMIIISHEQDFLDEIGITYRYEIKAN